jgi:hypothetical protein
MTGPPFSHAGSTWGRVVDARPKVTARALRYLGRPVPANVDDDDVIVLVER